MRGDCWGRDRRDQGRIATHIGVRGPVIDFAVPYPDEVTRVGGSVDGTVVEVSHSIVFFDLLIHL